MSYPGASVDTGFSQEKLYATARQAMRPQADVPQKDEAVKQTTEQLSSLIWETIEGKDGSKSFDLRTNDAVYLSVLSSALAEDEVESLSGKKKLNLNEKVIKALKEKMIGLAMETFSHNFFVAELSKMGVGAVGFQLTLFGVEPSQISEILGQAKREKISAIRTGLQQVASEKVLFGVVTGARVV